MKIAVGSENPVKIEAARRALKKVFGECKVVGVKVSSGVSSMPFGSTQILKGAKTRASQTLARSGANYGVGLEGGIEETAEGTFLSGFAAIVNRDGQWGIGHGGGNLAPQRFLIK